MKKQDKIIGIVGGMGPRAGLELHNKIILKTNATNDQSHVSVAHISFSNCIPDRTAFLNKEVFENPAFAIKKIVKMLHELGAQCIGIPCNTSHVPEIYDVLQLALRQENIEVEIKNMLDETIDFIRNYYKPKTRIGVLATNGTYNSGLYTKKLSESMYTPIIPNFNFQDQVIHRMVYDPSFGIKSTNQINYNVLELLTECIDFFRQNKAKVIILGCTEFSLIPKKYFEGIDVIDPLDILAQSLLNEVRNSAEIISTKSHASK